MAGQKRGGRVALKDHDIYDWMGRVPDNPGAEHQMEREKPQQRKPKGSAHSRP